jgi:hypothetical protein
MKELLIIFDLNGTLISRVSRQLEKKLAKVNPFCPGYYDFMFEKTQCYLRPHWEKFLEQIESNPNISIGIWTSAQKKNADGMTSNLFSNHNKPIEFILDRSHCLNAPMNIKTNNVIKDLNWLFQDETLSKSGKWNAKNTIIVDDTSTKAKRNPRNLLLIDEYTVLDKTFDCKNDIELLKLLAWVEKLEERMGDCGDIRTVIELFPLKNETL